ncbi:MAG: hypothetical protein SV186_02830 [Candidatus Nanohaloarchaea archaeon]|nr:hypothetical protein [Candidatus Nanohaloarchaea archaeon]
MPELTDEERTLLAAYVEQLRELLDRGFPDDATEEERQDFLRNGLQGGLDAPSDHELAELADRTGIDDPAAVFEELERKGVLERKVDEFFRLPDEVGQDAEELRVERERLVFDDEIVEELV